MWAKGSWNGRLLQGVHRKGGKGVYHSGGSIMRRIPAHCAYISLAALHNVQPTQRGPPSLHLDAFQLGLLYNCCMFRISQSSLPFSIWFLCRLCKLLKRHKQLFCILLWDGILWLLQLLPLLHSIWQRTNTCLLLCILLHILPIHLSCPAAQSQLTWHKGRKNKQNQHKKVPKCSCKRLWSCQRPFWE